MSLSLNQRLIFEKNILLKIGLPHTTCFHDIYEKTNINSGFFLIQQTLFFSYSEYIIGQCNISTLLYREYSQIIDFFFLFFPLDRSMYFSADFSSFMYGKNYLQMGNMRTCFKNLQIGLKMTILSESGVIIFSFKKKMKNACVKFSLQHVDIGNHWCIFEIKMSVNVIEV